MSHGKIDFGQYLHLLRKEHKLPQKIVADKLGIDISMLSKIEHGERQVQSHMLKPISELFDLEYKMLQIQFLNQRIEAEYGNEPYFEEAISHFLSSTNR
jgi:transcriptional regulator with XRE-family HTH domain